MWAYLMWTQSAVVVDVAVVAVAFVGIMTACAAFFAAKDRVFDMAAFAFVADGAIAALVFGAFAFAFATVGMVVAIGMAVGFTAV